MMTLECEECGDFYPMGRECFCQRNKELNEYKTVLKNLVDCLDQVSKDSIGVFQIAAIHGMPYKGKNYKKELKAAKELLNRE